MPTDFQPPVQALDRQVPSCVKQGDGGGPLFPKTDEQTEQSIRKRRNGNFRGTFFNRSERVVDKGPIPRKQGTPNASLLGKN